MKCLVELLPDRKLLDPNFDGYKLSLEPIPTWRNELTSKVDRVYPSEEQFPRLHHQLYGFHNHLVYDAWERSGAYFIDVNWSVQRVFFDPNSHKLQEAESVFEIPSHMERAPGHYNLSLNFCSEQYALLSDGAGTLHIAKTGKRTRSNIKWENIFSDQVIGAGISFLVIDSRLEIEDGKEVIHCLLQHVKQTEKLFETVIEWVTLQKDKQIWSVLATKQLQGKGCVHYVALEPKCRAIYIASDHPFGFIRDSQSEIPKEKEPQVKPDKKVNYTWIQTGEDITVTLQLGKNYDKKLLNVESKKKFIRVVYDKVKLLEGDLSSLIDEDLTTWNVSGEGRLDVLVTKCDSGAMWGSLLQGGDPEGEQVLDPSLVEAVHERLAHLCSESEVTAEGAVPAFSNQQLEECDAVTEENTCLVRLDSATHAATHQAPLSVHQVVLTVCLNPNEPPALGLRHDVDTCVWQLNKVNDSIWPVRHEGTLLAFGYVQSSKQQKKFTVCSPNMDYSIVCEANRHVFIYRKDSPASLGCQLRQRIGSGDNVRVKIGQQQVIALDKDGEVLGITATDEVVYILTEKNILALQMVTSN